MGYAVARFGTESLCLYYSLVNHPVYEDRTYSSYSRHCRANLRVYGGLTGQYRALPISIAGYYYSCSCRPEHGRYLDRHNAGL